jgi:hydroxypyruvate isomerase
MPRFAANIGFLFTEHPFLDRFGAAKRAGFEGVEFSSPYEHTDEDIAERLNDNNLSCVLFNLPMGDRTKGDFGIACLPGREAEFRDGVAHAMQYAATLGCPRVNCIAGKIPDGADPAELRAILVSNLRYAAREFKRAGLTLLVEPINTEDIPGFLVSRASHGAEILVKTGEDNAGLQFDIYHTAMMKDDPIATLDRYHAIVRHVQFADTPGRHEPGTGTIGLDKIFTRLDRMGYTGWTSAEYRPSKRTEDTLGWMPLE